MKKALVAHFFTLLIILNLCALTVYAQAPDQTALDRYVAMPDASYKYEMVKPIPGEGYTAYVLDMVSQS